MSLNSKHYFSNTYDSFLYLTRKLILYLDVLLRTRADTVTSNHDDFLDVIQQIGPWLQKYIVKRIAHARQAFCFILVQKVSNRYRREEAALICCVLVQFERDEVRRRTGDIQREDRRAMRTEKCTFQELSHLLRWSNFMLYRAV